jgi:hypothetical protein
MSIVDGLRSVPGGVTGGLVEDFEVGFVTAAGLECRAGLSAIMGTRFEECLPVRRFPSYKGRRHNAGRWWSATMGRHVGHESWLERDHLMLLDFDAVVTGISSQPLWLFWTQDGGAVRSHAPDYFARLADGSAVVVDCRPLERITPRDAAKFDATAQACELLGWQYRVVGALARLQVGNVRWLAGYRHPRHDLPPVAAALRAVFTEAGPLLDGAEAVGDPLAVLPVLFHLLWRHVLVTDLTVPLGEDAIVSLPSAGGAS